MEEQSCVADLIKSLNYDCVCGPVGTEGAGDVGQVLQVGERGSV